MDLPLTQVLNDNDDSFSSRSSGSSQRTPKRLYQVATLIIGNKKYPIFKGINKVGRNPGNDVCIEDITVSKIHAEIEADAKFAFVCDLRSSNKTRMNDEILRPERFYQLLDGTKLTFGIINGTYLFLRDNDESIIVPATPEPGLKLKREPKKSLSILNSSSNGESDDSVILGTQEAHDEAVFVKPLAPSSILNTKDSHENVKPSTSRSNNDIYGEETQRIDKAEGSIHESATQQIVFNKSHGTDVSIYDVETQRIDNGLKKKMIFDHETQNANDKSHHNDAVQSNILTQKDDNRDQQIYDIETKKSNIDDQDDLKNIATQKVDVKRNKWIYNVETQKANEEDCQDSDLYSVATQKLDIKRKKQIYDLETQKMDKADERDDLYYAATQRFQPLDIKRRKSDIHDVATQQLREKEDKSNNHISLKTIVNNSPRSHVHPQTVKIIMESDDENNEDDENYQPLVTQRVNMDEEDEGVEINAVQTVHDNEEKMENNLTKVSINKNNNDDKCNSEPRMQEESARNDVEIEENKTCLTSVTNQSSAIVEETDDESETDDEGVFASFLQKQDHLKAVCDLTDTTNDNVMESDLNNETVENDKIYSSHNNCPSPVLVSMDDISRSFGTINNDNNDADSDDEIYMTPNQIVSPLKSITNTDLNILQTHLVKSPSNNSYLDVRKRSVDDDNLVEIDLTMEATVALIQKPIKESENNKKISLNATQALKDTQVLEATQAFVSTQIKENKLNTRSVLVATQALEETQAIVATQAIEETQALVATQAIEETQALAATQALEATQSLIPTQIIDLARNRVNLADTQLVNTQIDERNVVYSKNKQQTIQQPVLTDTQAVALGSTRILDTHLLKELADCNEDEENISNVLFQRASRSAQKNNVRHHNTINSIERTQKLKLRGDKLTKDDAQIQMDEVINQKDNDHISLSRKSDFVNKNSEKSVKPLKLKKKQTSKNAEEWLINRSNMTDNDSFDLKSSEKVREFVGNNFHHSNKQSSDDDNDALTHKKEGNNNKSNRLKKITDKNQVNDSDSTDDELLSVKTKIPDKSLKTPSSVQKISLSLNPNTKEELQKMMEKNREINSLKTSLSRKSNDSNNEDKNKSRDEISDTLNNMFGEPDDENLIEPTQLQTQQLMDILKSPKQISSLSGNSNNVDKFLQADNRGDIKDTEEKMGTSLCKSSPFNEESQELYFSHLHSKRKRNVILDSQSNSGSEKSSKCRQNFSGDITDKSGFSGEKRTLRSDKITKGTEIKKSCIDEPKAGPSNINKKDNDEEIDCPGSPISVSSSDEYMSGNTAKVLKKQRRVAQARDKRMNHDESDSDPVDGNDENDEDFSFEKILKIADRFLPSEMKEKIFSGDRKKVNELSNDNNKVRVSARVIKKNEEVKEGNRNTYKKPLNVVRTRRGQKKNPDLFIGQEEKDESVIEMKTRGREKRNLETSFIKEENKKIVKKQPTKSRKKTDKDTSSSNSSSECQGVAQIFDNTEKEITKKRPATSATSPSLIETKKKKLIVSLDDSFNNSKRQSIRVQKHTVIFTGINIDNYIQPIKHLGGTITEDPNKATILVTDKVRRTFKFICAISRSIPIVSIKWIDACIKNHEFLDTDEYILRDQISEIRFDFDLNESLKKSSSHLLFKGYTFVITPKITNPTITEFKSMIQVAGGKSLIRAPRVWPTNSIIVGCDADTPKIREMMSKIPKDISVPVVTTEFVLSGILKQTLDFEAHKLHL